MKKNKCVCCNRVMPSWYDELECLLCEKLRMDAMLEQAEWESEY